MGTTLNQRSTTNQLQKSMLTMWLFFLRSPHPAPTIACCIFVRPEYMSHACRVDSWSACATEELTFFKRTSSEKQPPSKRAAGKEWHRMGRGYQLELALEVLGQIEVMRTTTRTNEEDGGARITKPQVLPLNGTGYFRVSTHCTDRRHSTRKRRNHRRSWPRVWLCFYSSELEASSGKSARKN